MLKIIDLKRAHEKIQEMEENLKDLSNENENLKSKFEMNLDTNAYISSMSKEQLIEHTLSKKKASLKPRHHHNSVDLVSKYRENEESKRISDNNLTNDFYTKNEISKSTYNIQQHLKAKLSKNNISSKSPINHVNYNSNVSNTDLNLNSNVITSKNI